MNIMPRWRPRDGAPTNVWEALTQFLWRWRIEIMLVYLVSCWTAALTWWAVT